MKSFIEILATALENDASLLDSGEDVVQWFESRSMPWEDVKRISRFIATQYDVDNHAEVAQAVTYGIMLGWVLHTQIQFENQENLRGN
jgi:hypothetical protein